MQLSPPPSLTFPRSNPPSARFDRPTIKLTPAQLRDELQRTARLISDANAAAERVLLRNASATATAATASSSGASDDAPTLRQRHGAGGSGGGAAGARAHSLSSARRAASVSGGGGLDASGTDGRRRWFRPGCGWFNAGTLAVAGEEGYTTVIGTVWPWDTHMKIPVVNALFCWLKAYPGAVVVLHDRCGWEGVLGFCCGQSRVVWQCCW